MASGKRLPIPTTRNLAVEEVMIQHVALLMAGTRRLRAVATTVFLLILACGDAESGASDAADELIIAWTASREPASLDGHIEPYQTAWLIDYKIADPLLILGPDGEFHPALAASWSSNEVADEWTFTLKSGVVFQDGTPFNAEAVKYNIERILDPATRSGEMAAHVGPVERVEVVDDTTVTLHYEAPWVTVLDAFRRVPIWSPAAAEQWGIEEFDRHLVGAGRSCWRSGCPTTT